MTTFILSLVWYWNDFLNTALFFTSYQPLAVKMANYASALNAYRTPEGGTFSWMEISIYQMIGALLFILPILTVYLLLQKKFTQSVQTGIVG